VLGRWRERVDNPDATEQSGFEKRAVEAPSSAMMSWAEPATDMANTVQKHRQAPLQYRIIGDGRSGALTAKVPI
jgi:hypothetical protein